MIWKLNYPWPFQITPVLQLLQGGNGSPFDSGMIRSFAVGEQFNFRIRFRRVELCLNKLNVPLCGANSPVRYSVN
jgi:hypothetical protein